MHASNSLSSDGLQLQVSERFNDHMKISCKSQHLVPRYVRNAKYDDIVDMIEFYKSDISEGDMRNEFECWKVKWNRESRTEEMQLTQSSL